MKTLPAPGIRTFVMLGAGFCTAVLFSVAKQQTLPALALAQLTPLPIMISTLGFGQIAGFGSAVVAALTIGLLTALHEEAYSTISLLSGLISAATFAVILALPAWWLGFLSCLGKPEGATRWHVLSADKRLALPVFFYPIGHILVHAAFIASCLVGLAICAFVLRYDSFDAAVEHLTTKFLPFVQKLVETRPELSSFDLRELTHLILRTMPATMAAWTLMMFVGNLWLAGRIVLTSNRLPRPWPNIAHELQVPRFLFIALALALAASSLKGWPGTVGLIAATTLGIAYALQGVAVAHDLSLKSRWRMLLLVILYVTLILLMPWSLALFALIALADAVFSLRDRKAALASSKS